MWITPSSWLCSPAYTFVFDACAGLPLGVDAGQFHMPVPVLSPIQWSQL